MAAPRLTMEREPMMPIPLAGAGAVTQISQRTSLVMGYIGLTAHSKNDFRNLITIPILLRFSTLLYHATFEHAGEHTRRLNSSDFVNALIELGKENVLPHPDHPATRLNKLLIPEEYPLIMWYWEVVLNFLHIATQTLHSGLDQDERACVVAEFRKKPRDGDLNHLSVSILMYTLNASGEESWRSER
ncbi:hypothetical protein B0A55_12969 [Friedmanniomyces simplex]|uniref:Uncharacterized protein n=1 Tax=Friedmanniomyces simplex TaxID=329884 RepID=A0A4U0VWR2_9PEZI|nr:hypothetical protein B0A55_12969 [Friedmanniomyces simplex]